ncbi:cysteine--tRNA ligase [Azospirillum argentinense]
MSLHLTNTLTRTKERFVPADPDRVTMYVCGPTVYDYAHVGNARSAVVFDVLHRVLKRRFARVVYARNVTDVDDKINAAAQAAGVPIGTVTGRFLDAYHADMAALGVSRPTVEPRVTDHIPDIVAMIGRLLAAGNAYDAEGHVLFHVPSFPDYGRLSRRCLNAMIAGARVEVAPFKRHPADFVLWKPSTPDLPGWDSPWGRGRPGWHIECSSMIGRHLGGTIDLHGGGQDLIFPHHENEIAQGTCAHGGRLYCRFWVHNGFVTVEGRKMSKSLGNVRLVRDLLAEAPGPAIRLALLTTHYRRPLDWTAEALRRARRSFDRLRGALDALDGVEAEGAGERLAAFDAALDDDLNTPLALAELFRLAQAARRSDDPQERAALKAALLEGGARLGLLGSDAASPVVQPAGSETRAGADDIQALLAARGAARAAGDFARADHIRALLARRGVTVEDRPDRTVWRSGAP